MTDEPKSFSTLRRFYKTRREVDIDLVWDEYDKQSDRACVILAAAGLEDTLALLLMQKMRRVDSLDDYDPLFEGPTAPLSSFSAKISLCYFLEIIDKRLEAQLTAIRHMRNACAHSQHAISFANKELATVCQHVFAPNGTIPSPGLNNPDEIRHAFISEAATLEAVIIQGREAALAWIQKLVQQPTSPSR